MNSIYSYADFIKNTNNFRTVDHSGENRYDSPAFLYYKIFFYFNDDNGLLGTKYMFDQDNVNEIQKLTAAFKSDSESQTSVKLNVLKNTAFSFLLLNNENERALYLRKFVCLLSEINSNSPWYFTEISGLDGAIERKVFSEGELKIEDKPQSITIKCLQDSYDNRLGMLLDLYRAACFSYQNKKEIVPANLRKFNMGIALFSQPIRGKGGKSGDENSKIMIPYNDEEYSFYIPSVKYFEFRNCEIDVNSSKTAYSTINTTEQPFSPEYTITINYDDCYESRYNDVLNGVVTDFINIDISRTRAKTNQGINGHGKQPYNDNETLQIVADKYYWINTDIEKSEGFYRSSTLTAETISNEQNLGIIDGFEGSKNIAKTGLISNVTGIATEKAKSLVNKLYMGNIYTFSLANTGSTVEDVLSGNVIGGVKNLAQQAKSLTTTLTGGSLVGKKIPGYDTVKTEYLSILNKMQSVRNNL